MYGNGAQIGMATTAEVLRQIQLVLTVVLAEFFVAVAGTTMRGLVARRIAATSRPATATTSLASASPSLSNNLFKNVLS